MLAFRQDFRQKIPMLDAALIQRVRVRKEDSAFVYAILESYEGICSYSTLDGRPEDLHRDLELQIPFEFVKEVQEVLGFLGEMVFFIDQPKSP